ncbi:hypothetical protein FRC11_012518 [Ceratobasidium sp. 423]|nr:hypothetical protein FRC11_012518 [Ceratobasidium sp. 423]
MGKSTNSNALRRASHDEQDLQQAHGSQSSSPSLLPPRHSRLHGLASASPATASSESLVGRIAKEHSSHRHRQSIDGPLPNIPEPHEHPRDEPLHIISPYKSEGVLPSNAEHCDPTLAATETSAEPIPESSSGKSSGDGKPPVKVLLCGNNHDYFSAADLEYLREIYLKYVKGVRPDNIRVHSGPGPISEEFDWFFDPKDIAPGGLLILCIIGHGTRTAHGVDIRMDKRGQKLMGTLDLHVGINRLQVPCTLEVVLGTCNSEVVIDGLDRLMWMQASNAAEGRLAALPSLSALLKALYPSRSVPKLSTGATIIVWAAAVDGGLAYEEADLPGRKGKNDIMIGAICRAIESAGRTIPRKALFGKIQCVGPVAYLVGDGLTSDGSSEAVSEYNAARDEKYLSKTKAERRKARDSGKYGDPQSACLLSLPGNREVILNGPAFEAVRGVEIAGTLSVE